MKKHPGMAVFGTIVLIILALGNLMHLLWTVWLCAEQLQTSWGGGTGLELGVLYPWLTELLCLPGILCSTVYFILSIFRRHEKKIIIANGTLFSLLLLQFGLTNLFIWY